MVTIGAWLTRTGIAAGLLLPASAFAQSPPVDVPLVPVPARLPAPLRDSLEAVRAGLEARVDGFNAIVPVFLARCGPGRISVEDAARIGGCETEHRTLLARQEAIVAAKAAFRSAIDSTDAAFARSCSAVEADLARDREALRRQQAVNAAAAVELERWAEENAAAQRAALMVGAKAILGDLATRLQAREAGVARLRDAIVAQAPAMRSAGISVEDAREVLVAAEATYARAAAAARAGAATQRALEADAWYALLRTEAGAIATRQAEGDAAVRTLLEHRAVAWVLERDPSLSDLIRAPLDLAMATPTAAPIAPHYALAAFLVDYGYEATRWSLSGSRILGGDALAGEGLRAVEVLSARIRRTLARRDACRAAGLGVGPADR
jgi:hypothetical protein